MRTNRIPSNGSRAWAALAAAVLLYSWLLPPATGSEYQPLSLLLSTAAALIIIWFEVRRLLYWRRHRDYANASKALRAAALKRPEGRWNATPDGHSLCVFRTGRFLARRRIIMRIDTDELLDADADLDSGNAASVLVLPRYYLLTKREYRVITFTGMTRCWPDGSEENVMLQQSWAETMWKTRKAARFGLFDVGLQEIQQLTRELETAEPIEEPDEDQS